MYKYKKYLKTASYRKFTLHIVTLGFGFILTNIFYLFTKPKKKINHISNVPNCMKKNLKNVLTAFILVLMMTDFCKAQTKPSHLCPVSTLSASDEKLVMFEELDF